MYLMYDIDSGVLVVLLDGCVVSSPGVSCENSRVRRCPVKRRQAIDLY
jgi:hypothetical protein